ncbi:protein CDV3 homolog isoform X2 [Temnothorax americanus]|uniref:protein CDV3 homolog isoform X2 n=1 Tax=Temnothorax americanus TaxID=1964332 RepID=UPI00406781A5
MYIFIFYHLLRPRRQQSYANCSKHTCETCLFQSVSREIHVSFLRRRKAVNVTIASSTKMDEDEWKEFEEEKKDYSGLKIGHLTVNDSVDAESDGEGGAFEIGSDGEIVEGGAKHTGPWKKREAVPEAPAAVAAEVVEPTPPAPPAAASSTGSSYKAPHLRNQPTFASPRPRGRNIAPDINSEEYFPTLNSKPPQPNNGSGPWGTRRRREEGAFEEVRNRGGGRSYNVPDSQAKLSLGNKYGALSQDQS